MKASANRDLSKQINAALIGTLPAGDAELVAMAQQVAEIQAKLDANSGVIDMAHEKFEDIRPPMPLALLWRSGDPIGHTPRQFDLIENGRRYPWCDTTELARFAGKTLSDLRQQVRLDEIRQAFTEHDQADNAAYVESGLCAAEGENTALVGQQTEIISRMCKIPPTTIEGHRALASVFIIYCWDGKISPPGCMNEKILGAMFSALTGLPIEQPEQVQ